MRDARAAKTSDTNTWPMITRGQVQIPSGPPQLSTAPYVVKIPVVMEMNEKPTAKEAKRLISRRYSCLYPYFCRASSAKPLCGLSARDMLTPFGSVPGDIYSGSPLLLFYQDLHVR